MNGDNISSRLHKLADIAFRLIDRQMNLYRQLRMGYSPLLKSMKPEERNFNVAIGSAYIGNRFLIRTHHLQGRKPQNNALIKSSVHHIKMNKINRRIVDSLKLPFQIEQIKAGSGASQNHLRFGAQGSERRADTVSGGAAGGGK